MEIEKKKEAYEKEVIFTNFVISGNFEVDPEITKPNLRDIASTKPYLQWRSDYFESIRLTLCDPLTSLSLFNDYRFSIMGAQSAVSAYLAALKFVNMINCEMGIPCKLANASIRNVVASVKVFPIDLDLMRSLWPDKVSPKVTFPGAYFYYKQVYDTNVVIAIFETGSINFIGGKSKEEVLAVFSDLYDNYLVKVRFDPSGVRPKAPPQTKSTKELDTALMMESELHNVMHSILGGGGNK